VLADDPDFDEPQALLKKIETGVVEFAADMEKFFN